jgi:hypothetical protein
VRPSDRLCFLEMSVPWHQDVNLGLGSLDGRLDKELQVAFERAQLFPEPQPHVCRNLLIPAAASMQLSSNVLSDDFAQPALVGCVDVFVIGFDFEAVRGPFLLDLSEAANSSLVRMPLLKFARAKATDPAISSA